MQYAKIVTPIREALVPLELYNWGLPFANIFEQAGFSGWETWLAYRHNDFNNPLQKADEQCYNKRGNFFVEMFHDIVMPSDGGEDSKGKLWTMYIALRGTEWEKEYTMLAPRTGWYVPTDDGIFVPGTLMPFETIQDRGEAMRRLETNGIPPEEASLFIRPGTYSKAVSVGRRFSPGRIDGGKFDIAVGGPLSGHSDMKFASREVDKYRPNAYKYTAPEIVMEVNTHK